MKSPKRFANRTVKDLRSEAVKLINQRMGTPREPAVGLTILDGWTKGGRETKEDYIELIEFLEAGEPAEKTRAHERLNASIQKLMENHIMATKKIVAKKGSVFGAEEPKGAVDRPKAAVDKNKKPFVPTTPEELKDIEKTAAKKAEAKTGKKAAVKKADAAKAPSAKAAEPKASTAGRKSRIDGTKKITVLVDANPKREGSGAHARFAKYKTGITVSKALELGVTMADLAYDTKNKYISIA